MRVSNNSIYEPSMQTDVQPRSRFQAPSNEKQFQEAYRLDLSPRAMMSSDFNNPFDATIYNEDALEYTKTLDIIAKP